MKRGKLDFQMAPMFIKSLCLLLVLLSVQQGMADNNQSLLLTQLLPPQINLGMSHEAFNQLNLATDQMPGTEKSPNALVFVKDASDFKSHSLLFVDGRLASTTCTWRPSNDGINDFAKAKELLVTSSEKIIDIEIGKRTKMHDPVRLTAQLVNLRSGTKLLVQANDIEISMTLFDEPLMKNKSAFMTFEELAKQPAYKNQFLQGVQFSPTKPQNNQIIPVRDYLKDGFASSLPDRDLPVQNKPLDINRNEVVKLVAVSEDPTASTLWSIIVVLIVAATGLLWLLVKNRK
jgi:hypothetical protein